MSDAIPDVRNGNRPTTAETRAIGDQPAGYYGKPIVRAHIWEDSIGWYFFTGGLAGAASIIAAVAEIAGDTDLGRHARRAAMIGLLPSPVLLISDLGRPERFYNMLRVFKLTSPMSLGSWLLVVYSPASAGAWLLNEVGRFPRTQRFATIAAGLLGSGLATYTAVLVADTATPVWNAAKNELPYVFAASAAASSGAATQALAAIDGTATKTAAQIAVVGACCELGMAELMKRRLGPLDTYSSSSRAQRFDRMATVLSGGGAIGTVLARRRPTKVLASIAILAGAACERLAVIRAGTASAEDPRSVLLQQSTAS